MTYLVVRHEWCAEWISLEKGGLPVAFISKDFTLKKCIVRLTAEEQAHLSQTIRSGQAAARVLLPARILLKADSGPAAPAWSEEAIGEALEVQATTVARVHQRFVEEGLQAALRPHRAHAGTSANGTAKPKRT